MTWLVGVCLWFSASTAMAQRVEPLVWPEEAKKVGPTDYALTGLALSSLALTLAPERDQPWVNVPEVDKQVRLRLRANSTTTRYRAEDATDVLSYVSLAHPLLVDSLLLAGFYRRSRETAWQLAAMTAEALIINKAVTAVVKDLAQRSRPGSAECRQREDAEQDPACEAARRSEYRSFFSGHSSLAATAAGTSCVFHARLGLYDNNAADWATCAALSGIAVTTGVLRVVADRHYLTDVITGLTVGFAIGAAVPALHLPRRNRRTRLSLQPGPGGVSLWGRF